MLTFWMKRNKNLLLHSVESFPIPIGLPLFLPSLLDSFIKWIQKAAEVSSSAAFFMMFIEMLRLAEINYKGDYAQ